MTTDPTGGPAFPGKAFTKNGHPNGESMGMTQRDYLEAQCLKGFCAGMAPSFVQDVGQGLRGGKDYINAARALARAMLAARANGGGHDE